MGAFLHRRDSEHHSGDFQWRFSVEIFSGDFSGPKLSPSAAASNTAGQIWELFFTEEILNIIVENTNR
jgi:hypothetical protein